MDASAARCGLFSGQKATDAAALVPELVTAEADPAADTAALTALVDWCARFSPAVAPDPPDGLFLDITGADHLWGGEGPMMADLARHLAANGLPIRAAIAGSLGAAWALAHFGPDRSVAREETTAALLAPLPIAALRLAPEDAAQIIRLGLTTISALAAQPRDPLGRRFGPDVMRRLDQALGLAAEALEFRRPPSPWFQRVAFAEPISMPEDLARAAGDIVQALCARLEAGGRGARGFDLAFHRLDGRAERVSVGLALPGRDAAAITRLILPKLDYVDPGFGIEVTTLLAHEVEVLCEKQTSLTAPADKREDLAPLIDRLTNRLGEQAVWRAEAFPSHAPERAVRRRPPLSSLPSPLQEAGWDPDRPRPLRIFRRPEPVEATAPTPDDPPMLFRWRGRVHRVRRAEGPERLVEEWWCVPFDRADPLKARDYYQVEDEAGGRFWLFRAGFYGGAEPPTWWLHGLFG